MQLDNLDRRILDALQRNAKLSNVQLAEEVGLIHSLGLWVFEQCCNDLFVLRSKVDEDGKRQA